MRPCPRACWRSSPACRSAARPQAAAGNCPAASQIGTTTVGVGAGASPLYVPQPGKAPTAVYLAGPYKGAPYSLVVKVPAQAGPFDLGTVAVRSALARRPGHRPGLGQVRSPAPDPRGHPDRLPRRRVEVDRPDFTLNPTSCDPMEVDGHDHLGSQGQRANASDRFQVGQLRTPRLQAQAGAEAQGRDQPRRLPGAEGDPDAMPRAGQHRPGLGRPCRRPSSSPRATSGRLHPGAVRRRSLPGGERSTATRRHSRPLLDKPLQGPVYLQVSSNNPLPDLVAALDGQIHIDLAGRIDSVNGGIRNTFELGPRRPGLQVRPHMQGGKKGLLVNNTDLCEAKPGPRSKSTGRTARPPTPSRWSRPIAGRRPRRGRSARSDGGGGRPAGLTPPGATLSRLDLPGQARLRAPPAASHDGNHHLRTTDRAG